MQQYRIIMITLLTGMLSATIGSSAPHDGPSAIFLDVVLESVEHVRSVVGEMQTAAEAAAVRTANGGRIFVTDDETIFRTGDERMTIVEGGGYAYPMHEDWGGFVAEACDRAGGLRHISPVPVSGEVGPGDVILVGTLDLNPESQSDQLSGFRDKGALVILFGSEKSLVAKSADYLITNGLDTGTMSVMTAGDRMTGPVAPVANVAAMWTFIAEYVAAHTREGRMPTLWQSMFMPGAAIRNDRIGDEEFHSDRSVTPVEPGVLGRAYCDEVERILGDIKDCELSKFPHAGAVCAETLKRGRTVGAGLIGHFMTSQLRMPSYPDGLFRVRDNEYGVAQLAETLGHGDLWLHIGYSYTPLRELWYARRSGIRSVAVYTGGPLIIGEGTPVAPEPELSDVYIDPHWQHGDAAVTVPGYDVPILPPSGIVMVTCYWMIVGETLAAMSE